MSVIVVGSATPLIAGQQASWIAALEPWRGLGYTGDGLRRYLSRSARNRRVLVARARAREAPLGVLVLQPGFLLGDFVALLAGRPEAARQGVGRALMAHVESTTFVDRRWVFVSADLQNADALVFYRRLGFKRVGRLPDLLRQGRTEILLRKGRPDRAAARAQARSRH